MYSTHELIRLAAYRAAMSRDIARRRTQCAPVATRVAPPLGWLDRMHAFWRRVPPVAQFAAVPLAILVQRAVFPRLKILGSLARWSTLIFGAVRGIGAVFSRSAGIRGRS